jgi:glycosyltransferase involved in cell wall biosynthesis
VPVRDATALATALAELVSDPARRETMGKAAVARAEDHFDERRVVDLVMDTYRHVAAAKGREDLVAKLTP